MHRGPIIFCLLAWSCVHIGCGSHVTNGLADKTYVSEHSASRIVFTEKQTAVVEWVMNEGSSQRNARIEVRYRFSGETTIIPNLTSSQIAYFPYTHLQLSSSGDLVVAHHVDGHREVFHVR